MSTSYEALAYCGVYCGDCSNFKKNANCAGCRQEAVQLYDCPTRACAIERGLLHCGLCPEYPCQVLADFYHSGPPFRLKAYHNMARIREIGADAWLAEQTAAQV